MQEFARQCIDAGGNAFVSHGVPVLQGIELYQRRPIFYSLGNFIFHTGKKAAYARDSIWQSVVASCEFDDEGHLMTLHLSPISLGGWSALRDHDLSRDVPHLVDGEYGEGILARLAGLSLPFKTRINIENGRGTNRRLGKRGSIRQGLGEDDVAESTYQITRWPKKERPRERLLGRRSPASHRG